MPKVIIYSKDSCPYCVKAKLMLEGKGVEYEEINIEGLAEEFEKLKKRTGMRTVPQIFIGERLIGGYTDMAALNETGELDLLLKA